MDIIHVYSQLHASTIRLVTLSHRAALVEGSLSQLDRESVQNMKAVSASFLATLYSSSWAGKARRTSQLRRNVDRSDTNLIDRSRTLAYDVNDHTIVSYARHSDHVPVTLLSRECLYGGIRRWILSLPLLFTDGDPLTSLSHKRYYPTCSGALRHESAAFCTFVHALMY